MAKLFMRVLTCQLFIELSPMSIDTKICARTIFVPRITIALTARHLAQNGLVSACMNLRNPILQGQIFGDVLAEPSRLARKLLALCKSCCCRPANCYLCVVISALFLVNVICKIDCLDADNSVLKDGISHWIVRYVFNSAKLMPSGGLFKIPQTARGEILCLSRSTDPQEDFKSFVESNGIKGLQFHELWTSAD